VFIYNLMAVFVKLFSISIYFDFFLSPVAALKVLFYRTLFIYQSFTPLLVIDCMH